MDEPAIPLINQNSINSLDEDQLGITTDVQTVCDLISKVGDHYVIALNGEWGSGKTSFLKCIVSKLKREYPENFNPVFIELWKLEKEEKARRAISRNIRDEFVDSNGFRRAGFLLDTSIQAISIVLSKFLGDIELSGEENLKREKISKEHWELDQLTYESLEIKAAKIIDKFKNESKIGVICIDDLDRCSPDGSLSLIENIKLFLHSLPCIFILSFDMELLRKYVKAKYAQMGIDASEDLSIKYIDKFIDLSINIPKMNDVSVGKFLDTIIGSNKPSFSFLQKHRELITNGIPGNPRSIKRFFAASLTWKKNNEELDVEQLKIKIIELFYPKIAQFFSLYPEIYRILLKEQKKTSESMFKSSTINFAKQTHLDTLSKILANEFPELMGYIKLECPKLATFLLG